jgi:diadenosine tetraphosphate (Ap4A) HIT family hydrolase
MAFELHHRLAADCFLIGDFPLCRALLMNDNRFPWCILVPRRDALRDLHDLAESDRAALLDEIDVVSRVLTELQQAGKINVAALGNQVPQLHVHVIARSVDDPAWPAPVWGAGTAVPYADGPAEAAKLHRAFKL